MIDKIAKIFGTVSNKIIETTSEVMKEKPEKKVEVKPETPEEKLTLNKQIKQKVDAISTFAKTKIEEVQAETKVLRHRLSNLLESNYEVGMTHLRRGDISDAIFRFKFIKKFWPTHLESYYQLAYCLVLKNKKTQAQEVLKELIAKDPAFPMAKELLKKVETDISSELATKAATAQEQGKLSKNG